MLFDVRRLFAPLVDGTSLIGPVWAELKTSDPSALALAPLFLGILRKGDNEGLFNLITIHLQCCRL